MSAAADSDGWPFADSPRRISAVPPPAASAAPGDVVDDEEKDEFEFEFEFASVAGNPEALPSITADEIFADGKIRPIYPVFNRGLLAYGEGEKSVRQPLLKFLIEERVASIPSSSLSLQDDLEGIPPGTYCIWKPGLAAQSPGSAVKSPDTVRKSSSTGSSRRRWIRDLVVGRSHSDGKEKFIFIAAEEKSRSTEKEAAEEEKKKNNKGKGKNGTEVDLKTAHRMYYGHSGSWAAANGGGSVRRKSYLPYKPGIVGFFASVNGFSRVHQPF